MKKILLVTIFLAVLALSACNTDTSDTQGADDSMMDSGNAIDDSGDSMMEDSTESDSMTDTGDMADDSMTEGDESISGTLIDLAGLGKQVQCSYEDEHSQATVYVSGNKFRSDGIAKDSGMNVHTINDGDYIYIWSDSEPQGTKMSLDYIDEMSGDAPAEYNDEIQMQDTEYSFVCSPWIPKQSFFEVPGDVEFVDMQEMMEGMMDEACAQCDNLEGDQKAQCLQMMSC